MLAIVVPFLLSGFRLAFSQPDIFTNMNQPMTKLSKIGHQTLILLTMPLHHALLKARTVNAKTKLEDFLKMNGKDICQFRKLIQTLKDVETEERNYNKFELGSETILQTAIALTMALLVLSETRTSQGLLTVFKEDGVKVEFLGISWNDSAFFIAFSILLSIFTYTIAQYQAIRSSHKYFPFISKLLIIMYCLTSLMARIISTITYFAPSLGLFNLLRHFQAEQVPFKVFNGNYEIVDNDGYLINSSQQLKWNEVDTRVHEYGNYLNSDTQTKIPLEKYMTFTLKQYFWSFIGLYLAQILMIFVAKWLFSIEFMKLNALEKLMHCIENSHLAFPVEEWDKKHGTSQTHRRRMVDVKFETLFVILINGVFHLFSIIPSLILSKILIRVLNLSY